MTLQKLLDDLKVTMVYDDGFYVVSCGDHGFILPSSYEGGLDLLYGGLILQSQGWDEGKGMAQVASLLKSPELTTSNETYKLLFNGILGRYISAHEIRDVRVVGGYYKMRLVSVDPDDVLSTNQFIQRNLVGQRYGNIELKMEGGELYITTPSLSILHYDGPSVGCLSASAEKEREMLKAVVHKIHCDVSLLSDEYQKVVDDVTFGRAAFNAVEKYVEARGLRAVPLPQGYDDWVVGVPVEDLKLTDVKLIDGLYYVTDTNRKGDGVAFPNLTSMLASLLQVLTTSKLQVIMSSRIVHEAIEKSVSEVVP